MSLKKQIKEQKQAILKKDEELDNYKKNMRSTKMHEQDYEIKTYKEELLRMRHMMEQVLGQNNSTFMNPSHRNSLEQQAKQKDYVIVQL